MEILIRIACDQPFALCRKFIDIFVSQIQICDAKWQTKDAHKKKFHFLSRNLPNFFFILFCHAASTCMQEKSGTDKDIEEK